MSNCCSSLQLCAVLEEFLASTVGLGWQWSVQAVEINTKGVMIKEFGAKCSAQAYVHEWNKTALTIYSLLKERQHSSSFPAQGSWRHLTCVSLCSLLWRLFRYCSIWCADLSFFLCSFMVQSQQMKLFFKAAQPHVWLGPGTFVLNWLFYTLVFCLKYMGLVIFFLLSQLNFLLW